MGRTEKAGQLQGLETRTYHKKIFCEFYRKNLRKKQKSCLPQPHHECVKLMRKKCQEHLEPRQREQDFQKRGQLSCVSRAFGALHFCCDRIGCLPDRSVYMDVLIGLPIGNPNCLKKKMSSSSTKNYCICPSPFFVNKPITVESRFKKARFKKES